MRRALIGALSAWGWYIAGGVTVLLAMWLYARRLGFVLEVDPSEWQQATADEE